MLTSAVPAASSPAPPSTPSGIGAAGLSAGLGASPGGGFASVLDTAGQSVATATAAPNPTLVDASVTGPAVPNQPSPTLTLPTAKGPLVDGSPPKAVPNADSAAAAKRTKQAAVGPDPVKSSVPSGAPLPVPLPDIPSPQAAIAIQPSGATAPPSVASDAAGAVLTNHVPAAPASVANTTPSTSAAAPTSANEDRLTSSGVSSAGAPAGSSLADQAAVAGQVGLSVEDHAPGEVPPESPTAVQQATETASHAVPAPPVVPPPLGITASTATGSAPAANRQGASLSASARTPDVPSRSTPATNAVQTSPFAAVEPQSPAQIQAPPPVIPLAATPISGPTRSAPAVAPAFSPAAQVAQAVAEPVKVMLTSPAQAGAATPHVTTIQITPIELGRVEVRIERLNDGPARIQLVAERPETLTRLVHDQSQLQQALDHAGIPQSSRTIEFSLAPATTAGTASSTDLTGESASGGQSPSNGARQGTPYNGANLVESDTNPLAATTHTRIMRSAVDITA